MNTVGKIPHTHIISATPPSLEEKVNKFLLTRKITTENLIDIKYQYAGFDKCSAMIIYTNPTK